MDDQTPGWRPAGHGESGEQEAAAGAWITIGDPGGALAARAERTVTPVFHGEWNDPWAEELCSRPFSPTFRDQR